jgi:hypothetical protein
MKLNLDNYLPAPHMLAISGCHLFLVENMLIVSKTKTCTSMDLKKKISSEGCAPVFEDSKNKRSIKGQFMLTDTNVCLSSTCLLHPKKISCHYED